MSMIETMTSACDVMFVQQYNISGRAKGRKFPFQVEITVNDADSCLRVMLRLLRFLLFYR